MSLREIKVGKKYIFLRKATKQQHINKTRSCTLNIDTDNSFINTNKKNVSKNNRKNMDNSINKKRIKGWQQMTSIWDPKQVPRYGNPKGNN